MASIVRNNIKYVLLMTRLSYLIFSSSLKLPAIPVLGEVSPWPPLDEVYDGSPAGGYLNGAVIVTDGGRLCVRPSVF